MTADSVNHPPHYTSDPSGVECITITRHRNFNIGNALKSLWRAGLKDADTQTEDLNKAIWYILDEIMRLKGAVTVSLPADKWQLKYNVMCHEFDDVCLKLGKCAKRVTHLENFKAYVHKRLDDAGVPEDPNPTQTEKTGCRIESRLDHVLRAKPSREVSLGPVCVSPTADTGEEINAALLWGRVSAWLSNDVFGCMPEQLVATDPEQNFRPVANVEPLMRILGGAWAAAADRAHAVKEAQRDARPGAIIGGTVDGAFMADTLARGKGPVQPPAGVSVKPFVHAAGIGTDAEPKAPAADFVIGADGTPENPPA